MKPRLKPFDIEQYEHEIKLVQEPGVAYEFDNTELVRTLLSTLDGQHSLSEISAAVEHLSQEQVDLSDFITTLDELAILEDANAKAAFHEKLCARYESNLNFFSTFATLRRSRYDFQQSLMSTHVLLLGLGGGGSTVLYNLVGAGIGNITIVDSDVIEAKNLVRQFLYSERDIGKRKTDVAAQRARDLNNNVQIEVLDKRISSVSDITQLLGGKALAITLIDTPADIEDMWNAACVASRVPFIAAGSFVTKGMYYSVVPGHSGCVACRKRKGFEAAQVQPTVSSRASRSNSATGPVASLLGALVSMEALRYLTNFAPPVSSGCMWLVDFVSGRTDAALHWPRYRDCEVCGDVE